MTATIRSIALASAFALTTAAAIGGFAFKAETRAFVIDDVCAHAAWPMIPEKCLDGGDDRTVRTVDTIRTDGPVNGAAPDFDADFN